MFHISRMICAGLGLVLWLGAAPAAKAATYLLEIWGEVDPIAFLSLAGDGIVAGDAAYGRFEIDLSSSTVFSATNTLYQNAVPQAQVTLGSYVATGGAGSQGQLLRASSATRSFINATRHDMSAPNVNGRILNNVQINFSDTFDGVFSAPLVDPAIWAATPLSDFTFAGFFLNFQSAGPGLLGGTITVTADRFSLTPMAAVPLPAGLVLMASSLALLGALRRRTA